MKEEMVFDTNQNKVGVYKNAYDNYSQFSISIEELLYEIRSGGDYVDKIETIRSLYTKYKQTNSPEVKKEAEELKTNLQSYTIAGTFNPTPYFSRKTNKTEISTRLTDGFSNPSGIVVIDFDHLQQPIRFRNDIIKDPYVFASFISPSGLGVKIFVKVPITFDGKELRTRIISLQEYFQENHKGLDVSGKDITRLCFTSHDPDIQVNYDSKVYEGKKEELKRIISEVDISSFPNVEKDIVIEEIVKRLRKSFSEVKGVTGSRHHTMNKLCGQMWRWIRGCNLLVEESIDIFAGLYSEIFPHAEKDIRYANAQDSMYWAEHKDFSLEAQHPFQKKILKRDVFAGIYETFKKREAFEVSVKKEYPLISDLFKKKDIVFTETQYDKISIIMNVIISKDEITKKQIAIHINQIVELCKQFSEGDKERYEEMVKMIWYNFDEYGDHERTHLCRVLLSAIVEGEDLDLTMSTNDLIDQNEVSFDFNNTMFDNENNYSMYAQIISGIEENENHHLIPKVDFELPLTASMGGMFGIIAPPASGKTNLIINIAISFATANPIFSGIRFSPRALERKMLVADFENGKEFSQMKYTSVVEKYLGCAGGQYEDMNKVNFVSLGSSFDKKEDFFKMIRSGRYSIAVIDSLSMLVNSVNDEVENREFMQHLKEICDANQMSVIITSHTNKSDTTSGAGWSAQVLDQRTDALGILTSVKNDNEMTIIQLDMDEKLITSGKEKSNGRKMSKARHRGAGHYNLIMQWHWSNRGILERYYETVDEESKVKVPDEVVNVLLKFYMDDKIDRTQTKNTIYKLLKDKCSIDVGSLSSKTFKDLFNSIASHDSFEIQSKQEGSNLRQWLTYNGIRTIQTVTDSKLF